MFQLIFSLLLSSATLASNLGDSVYHMHQAVNYLGLFASGACISGKSIAKVHLNQIDSKELKNTDFERIYATVFDLYKIKLSKEQLVQFELLLLAFTDSLRKNAIKHEAKWHKEILI